MTGWTRVEGPALRFPYDNVDTDQLIPARFMSTPRSEGYGKYFLHDHPDRDTLNGATILIAGRNFGCGSSREAAVYALADFGIRAVLAPSFGDIFAANAVNNGLLPAAMDPEDIASLEGTLTVDLETCTVGGRPFRLDPAARDKLVNGWDDIDLTLSRLQQIETFTRQYHGTIPWSIPTQGDTR
ncbi:3-isopropylmalate dehydratase small subunit [Oceaniglobus roseus]|uniref:3-isopropylmalate dehydratase small subunit n=1 Tax=Oceaniglobus roseus TaxID=1737570 RepID=UPI000C7EB769|nr:3-isopropylmalate dehydratase small subunit [Kandeliimicrobium roseum]